MEGYKDEEAPKIVVAEEDETEEVTETTEEETKA